MNFIILTVVLSAAIGTESSSLRHHFVDGFNQEDGQSAFGLKHVEDLAYSQPQKRQALNNGDFCSCRQMRFTQIFLSATPGIGIWTCVESQPCYCSCPQVQPSKQTLQPGDTCNCRQERQINQTKNVETTPDGVWNCPNSGSCYCSCPQTQGSAVGSTQSDSVQISSINSTEIQEDKTIAGSRKKRFIRAKRSPQFKQTFTRGSIAINYECNLVGSCTASDSTTTKVLTSTTTVTTTTVSTTTTTASTTTTTASTTTPIPSTHVYTSAANHQPRTFFKPLNFPSGGSYTYTKQNGKSWSTGRNKREVPSLFNQTFEDGTIVVTYECNATNSCITGPESNPGVNLQNPNNPKSHDPQLFQNFLFGADNCKQFGNCSTVPTLMTTGGGNLEFQNEDSAKFYQTFSENSIIQNFDCRNGGCGDLGERLQKMFENLKKAQLKNLPLTVPVIYG